MKLLPVFTLLALLASCGDNSQPDSKKADSATVKAPLHEPEATRLPYSLPVPTSSWTTERFPIPIEFAPQIPYKGWEDIRFAPGWGDIASTDHWSYFFMWWLEEGTAPDAAQLQQYLTDYYNGLVGRNIPKRNIPKEKLVTTKVTISKADTVANDLNAYAGTVYMLNYLRQEPITLNVRVHERKCGERTVLFFEISPLPATHDIWKTYASILSGFKCE